MNTRILDALVQPHPVAPKLPTFADLKVGQPFKWVDENNFARNGVCIKLGIILDGEFLFKGSTGGKPYGWTSLANNDAGTVFSTDDSREVIPL